MSSVSTVSSILKSPEDPAHLSNHFIRHIQHFKPDDKGVKHLILKDDFDLCRPLDCHFDTIYWRDEFSIYDFYDGECGSAEKWYPMLEGETEQEYIHRLYAPRHYHYYSNGETYINKYYTHPELRKWSASVREVVAYFSDPKIQQKLIQLLKLCGEDITHITIKFGGNFIDEILKYLPNVKKITIDYDGKNVDTTEKY